MSKYEIYTDGSTRKNGAKDAIGGWAYAIYRDGVLVDHDSGVELNTTNQRMELTAAIKALCNSAEMTYVEGGDCIVFSDSAYLVNCYQQQWWINWNKNGWINSKKQPVANRELWEQLIPDFKNPHITFKKVKGHADDMRNNFVDKLAQEASAGGKDE